MTTIYIPDAKMNAIAIPKNWKTAENAFIPAGDDEACQEPIISQYVDNVNLATGLAEQFRDYLQTLGICSEVMLKVNSITSFDFAFLINEADYLSDQLDLAYEKAYELRKSSNTKTFFVYFHFIPKTQNLLIDIMISDGFKQYYEPTSEKSAAMAS
ncbi:hypothetical protein [Chitinophaga agri]|uniref:Uncharacterized protein n=1 Tax=Chitinophaga agri TaxID=2703787 RepID=A0A6B9ZMN0_9BACT|nr:hypothetical protein [Chitinophaga agri]QHS62704.1 hypothetical protein GWR21_24920 [Chitinophaga agri]